MADKYHKNTSVVRFICPKTNNTYVAKVYEGSLLTLDKTFINRRGTVSKIKLVPGEIEHIRCVRYLEKQGHLPTGSIYK